MATGEEFIRAAEERIYKMTQDTDTIISPMMATAILVELRTMYSVGYGKGYEAGALDEPYSEVKTAGEVIPFGRAPRGLGGHSGASRGHLDPFVTE